MTAAKAKTLDFTGVKEGGSNFRPRRKPEGDYFATIVAVADHESKEGNEGWVFTIRVHGDNRSSYPYYVGFDKNQLWKPRALCVAAGMKVPSAKVKLDPNKLVGKTIGIALEDDEYEGKVKSTITAVMPIDDLDDAQNVQDGKNSSVKAKSREADEDDEDEDEEDEPVPVKKSSKKRAPEPDDEDDEDEDDEDEPPAKSKKAKAPTKSKKRPVDEDDEDEDDDEDDEPAPKKSKAKPAPAKKSKRKVDDDDDDELDIDDL